MPKVGSEVGTGPLVAILGGMGPRATVRFYQRVVESVESAESAAQPHLLINHLPASNFFDGEPERFRELLKTEVLRMEAAGAVHIGIACNSAHAHFHYVREHLRDAKTNLLNLIEMTADAVGRQGFERPAVLCTRVALPLYCEQLDEIGLDYILPSRKEQRQLEDLIRRLLVAPPSPESQAAFAQFSNRLRTRGADCGILGCTDLPLLVEDSLELPLVCSVDVLLEGVLAAAGERDRLEQGLAPT